MSLDKSSVGVSLRTGEIFVAVVPERRTGMSPIRISVGLGLRIRKMLVGGCGLRIEIKKLCVCIL